MNLGEGQGSGTQDCGYRHDGRERLSNVGRAGSGSGYVQQALLLRQFQLNVGPKCSGSSSRAVNGGFSVAMACSSPTAFLEAFGANLSDAAGEARLLEALDPRRGCTYTSLRQVSSGHQVVDIAARRRSSSVGPGQP
ncbi:hypothetical protein [Micromonospora parathelypteridis]|uniref:Uncharacterized protein n=1 Tax=Micromonospora parathelypteridis TaxID=1839617 RepID=A0A840VQB9_9ACTN|nr:hypothetical protein [Micromonospora parathelypteridis]MBB5476214.1 hypothetical protein [Micromonospora parathelypteridis]